MQPFIGSPPLVSFPASLFRQGQNPVVGLAQLTAGARPSFEIVDDKTPYPLSYFKVPLARRVTPQTYGRDVLFTLPIAPFDRCRLVFKEVEHTSAFYQKLLELDAAVPPEPSNNVVFRATNEVARDRPRPLSAAPGLSQVGVVKKPSLNFKPRPAEAPASLVPPTPPRRVSSLPKTTIPPPPRVPSPPKPASPRSSSLPSTSTVLPEDFRSSRSLEPSELTLVPNTPTPPTPVTPKAMSPFFPQTKKKFDEEDGLEAFYPEDITLIRHLERGSQGTVDLVSTKFYRRVALKNFDRRVRQWEAAATRELCSLLKTVTHPNIVQSRGVLFASPTEKDKPIGVLMEYMDCGSVHTAIYDLSLTQSPTTPLNWCRQAASALAFLHRRRLVHRDVKPANMLLCDGGKKLKISDFGLCAKVDTGMTADVGTVVYMAPEVVANHSSRAVYDQKCDVYSLGVSLWEMVHRRRPHDGVGFLALLSAVRDGSRPQIDNRICSSHMTKLIERMWSENSTDRPDMEEVHEEVEKMLDMLGFFDIYE